MAKGNLTENIEMLDGIETAFQSSVQSLLKKNIFPKKRIIFSEEADFEYAYFIEKGYVKICRKNRAGDEVFLHISGPGDSIGSFAVFNGNKYPVTAIALTEVSAWVLKAKDYSQLRDNSKKFADKVSGYLFKRVQYLNSRMLQLSADTIEQRLESFFRSLVDEFGLRGAHSIKIPFFLNRRELAQAVNTRTETATRIMNRWQREKLVITEKTHFIVSSKFYNTNN